MSCDGEKEPGQKAKSSSGRGRRPMRGAGGAGHGRVFGMVKVQWLKRKSLKELAGKRGHLHMHLFIQREGDDRV